MNKNLEDARAKLSQNNLDPSLANYYYDTIKEQKGSINEFNQGIDMIIKGKPVQYVIGNVDFYGNIIDVNENVLIPRFETERLVELTIEKVKDMTKNPVILDIGTGSGCIAIALKKELDCEVDAIDISDEALKVAKNNALKNDVKITFYKSNVLRNVSKKFDVIISNPPYIREDEEIMDVVKNNEPHIALYAPNNGLYFYEEILKNCIYNLKEKYLIAFEIGYEQKDSIIELANKYLDNINIETYKDYSDKDRYIFISSK